MSFILVLLYFIFLIWFLHVRMDISSKTVLFIFVSLWFLALILAVNGVSWLYDISDYSFFLLVLNVCSFFLGFNLVRINSREYIDFSDLKFKYQIECVLNNRIFQILVIVLFLYMLYLYSIFSAFKAAVENLGELRDAYFSNELFGREGLIIGYFFKTPMIYMLCPLFAYCCIYKRNWLFVLMAVILYIESSLSGGRFGYLRCFVLPLLFVGLVFRSKTTKLMKVLTYFIPVVLAFLAAITAVTAMRMGDMDLNKETMIEAWETTSEHLISYFAGPSVAFDRSIDLNYVDRIGGYSLGLQSFSFVEGLFNVVMGKFGINYESPLTTLVELKQNARIYIGNGISWNALYTWNLMFYTDLGLIGVILFPFLFGLIIRILIKKFYRKRNLIAFWILYILFSQIAFSPIDYQLTNIGIVYSLIYFYFFNRFIERKSAFLN